MLLPLLGGTPAVWNTSMMFYQSLLLLGYFYAHIMTRYLKLRQQLVLHLIFLLAALVTLPIIIPDFFNTPSLHYPIPWLLAALFIIIGAPLFVLCATAPLLQYWFSTTTHREAHDPYFLYAASNLGSMLALLAYPFLIEPLLTLHEQSMGWSITFGILILFIIGCSTFLNPSSITTTKESISLDQPSLRQQLRWILLAFVPSSLLLAVTTYLTTDVASIPLLWVIPLAIYLLTFIITFSHQHILRHDVMLNLQTFSLAIIILLLTIKLSLSFLLIFLLQLLNFFIFAMVCHGELANTRPPTPYLTKFYLWIAVGGLLGGVFNALIAPFIFNTIWEYPIVLALACFLRPLIDKKENKLFSILFSAAILLFSINIGITIFRSPEWFTRIDIYFYLIANFLIMLFAQKPIRYGILISLLLFFGYTILPNPQPSLAQVRTFFGIYKIVTDQPMGINKLVHGTTVHGAQYLQRKKQKLPLTYYSKPLKEIFSILPKHPLNIAAIGLGTGTVACYRRLQDTLTFFEIDPAILQIAQNPRYFTFLQNCPPTKILLGDARLTIQHEPTHFYDIILVDAFSSDAIPIHLLTKEAIQIYLKKLNPTGIIVFHISNRHLKLAPILARIGNELHLQSAQGTFVADSKINLYIYSSQWVVLSRSSQLSHALLRYHEWKILLAHPDTPIWRDDFSNVLSAIVWKN